MNHEDIEEHWKAGLYLKIRFGIFLLALFAVIFLLSYHHSAG